VVLFNGSNNDEKSRQIYADWRGRHIDTDRVTGSRSADMRSALVDYFREQGRIMIATEAGAEGINLQFCSLVVNYDLPWNPQRIEQRIGRCHRYGQEHDVVVVNFLNQKNAADQRVFQLLSEKFSLFEGVFGASDEVLGAIESGLDFEKRIAEIYQRCRTPEEINASFDQLQQDLSQQIDEAVTRTRQQLLENFDAEVIEKLRISRNSSHAYLAHYERRLMDLTHHELRDHIKALDGVSSFQLTSCPVVDDIPVGLYELPRRSGEAYLYRLAHPLAQHILAQAKNRALPPAEMIFDYTHHLPTISALKPLVGQEGSLRLSLLTIKSLDQVEDYLIFARILVVPKGEVSSGFHPFSFDTSGMHYQPVDRDLLIQHLRTHDQETLSFSGSQDQEPRIADYLVRGLIDYDDISYDDHADLLYNLAGQMVKHLLSYLSEEDTRNVLIYHQRQLVQFIHAQMQAHYWEKATGYDVVVSKGFTALRQGAFTAPASDPVYDIRQTVEDRSRIAQMLFGGFQRCLYSRQKFQSDSE
jgi:hypothetical protein